MALSHHQAPLSPFPQERRCPTTDQTSNVKTAKVAKFTAETAQNKNREGRWPPRRRECLEGFDAARTAEDMVTGVGRKLLDTLPDADMIGCGRSRVRLEVRSGVLMVVREPIGI